MDLVGENIDLAVRIGHLDDSADLLARQIGVQRMVIVGAPDYLAKRGEPRSPADLAAHDCIVGRRRGHRAAWLLKHEDGSVTRHAIPVKHEIQDFETVHRAVKTGRGLAQLPLWMVQDDIAAGSLLTVLDGLSGGEAPISLLWPQTTALPARMRVVIDGLVRGTRGLAGVGA